MEEGVSCSPLPSSHLAIPDAPLAHNVPSHTLLRSIAQHTPQPLYPWADGGPVRFAFNKDLAFVDLLPFRSLKDEQNVPPLNTPPLDFCNSLRRVCCLENRDDTHLQVRQPGPLPLVQSMGLGPWDLGALTRLPDGF